MQKEKVLIKTEHNFALIDINHISNMQELSTRDNYDQILWPSAEDILSSQKPLMDMSIDTFFETHNNTQDVLQELTIQDLQCEEQINNQKIQTEAYCYTEKDKIHDRMVQENKKRRKDSTKGYITAEIPTESSLYEYTTSLCLPLNMPCEYANIPEVHALSDPLHSYSVDIHGCPIVPDIWTKISIDLIVGTNIYATKAGLYSNYDMGPGAFLFCERYVCTDEDVFELRIRTVNDITTRYPDGLLS